MPEGVMEPMKKSNPGVEVLETSESVNPNGRSIAIARYVTKARNGSVTYSLRGFVAAGDICGDLEFYSSKEFGAENADIKKILASYRLTENYTPRFKDLFVYAKILFDQGNYKKQPRFMKLP